MCNKLHNPCKECICLPNCIAKSKDWKTEQASRFTYLVSLDECKLVNDIWWCEIYNELNMYMMRKWWSKI